MGGLPLRSLSWLYLAPQIGVPWGASAGMPGNPGSVSTLQTIMRLLLELLGILLGMLLELLGIYRNITRFTRIFLEHTRLVLGVARNLLVTITRELSNTRRNTRENIVSRESTFHLYEVKVESRFSRNGPVNLGRRRVPSTETGMLRIYLPTYHKIIRRDSILARKSEKSKPCPIKK